VALAWCGSAWRGRLRHRPLFTIPKQGTSVLETNRAASVSSIQDGGGRWREEQPRWLLADEHGASWSDRARRRRASSGWSAGAGGAACREGLEERGDRAAGRAVRDKSVSGGAASREGIDGIADRPRPGGPRRYGTTSASLSSAPPARRRRRARRSGRSGAWRGGRDRQEPDARDSSPRPT